MSDTSHRGPEVRVYAFSKADGTPPALRSNAVPIEDEFAPFYEGGTQASGISILTPPYAPAALQRLIQENNTLGPCVSAMVTNVHGTGFTIEKEGESEKDNPDDPKVKTLVGFFAEVYPGESFLSVRKKMGRDVEEIGNGYIEIIRNAADEVVFARYLHGRAMRLCRYDAPVRVRKTLARGEKEVSFDVWVRERRIVQMVSGKFVYFREFGSSRHMNAETGTWETDQVKVPIEKRATEVLHFIADPDGSSPYGVPRWIGQLPSVLGSRKAEEHNLDYFDAGGVPPAMVVVQGGYMAEEAKKTLETALRPGSPKNRVVVLEVQSTGGTLESAGAVKVSVERFGGASLTDALFQDYDKQGSDRTRRGFRLPSLFLGGTEQMTFATAFAAYLVTEEQVFGPERESFDEVVTRKLLPEIDGKGYVYRSKKLAIKDVAVQLQALTLAFSTQRVDAADIIGEVNTIGGFNLKVTEAPPPGTMPGQPGMPGQNPFAKPGEGNAKEGESGKPFPAPLGGSTKPPSGAPPVSAAMRKAESPVPFILADEATSALRKRDYMGVYRVVAQVMNLTKAEQDQFRAAVSMRQFFDTSYDPGGLSVLAGCTLTAMQATKGR